MSSDEKSARAILNAWREQQADHLDPVRFHFIDTLASRADAHDGETRRILDERLDTLLADYANDLQRSQSGSRIADSAEPLQKPTRGALGGLLEYIGGHAMATAAKKDDAACRPSSLEELPALDEFRRIWTKVRTEGQLRQSLEGAPAGAGPLNSGVLVHQAITRMRELSPGYLQHFLSYVDTLSWMEQMHGDGVLGADTSRITTNTKHPRNKPRKRRD
jgi:hypothetical protein